nr:MAG: attachment glycoprotein [Jingmen rodent narmovirus 1]
MPSNTLARGYYTGDHTGRINTNVSSPPQLQSIAHRYTNYLASVVHILSVLGTILALINIILGIIIIVNHTKESYATQETLTLVNSEVQTVNGIKGILSENVEPKVRSILDSVSFQLPKLLSSYLGPGTKCTSTPPPVQAPNKTPSPVTQPGQSQDTGLIVGNLTQNVLLLKSLISQYEICPINKGYLYQTHLRVPTAGSFLSVPKSCTRKTKEDNLNLIPAFIGTINSEFINSCTRQPVIAIDNGIYSLTYMTMRGTCQDHRKSSRHFEIGILKRDGFQDPVLTPVHHWVEAAVPAYDGCSLAINKGTAYSLCTSTTDGPPTDMAENIVPSVVLFAFDLEGNYGKRVLDTAAISKPERTYALLTLTGQAAIRDHVYYAFGYRVFTHSEEGNSKCVTAECGDNIQEQCNSKSRLDASNGRFRGLIVWQVDLSDTYYHGDKFTDIPRSQYYQITNGNIYGSDASSHFLYQLVNTGWYNKPMYGRMSLGDTVTLNDLARTYDTLSSTEQCPTSYGCPSDCSITTSATYYPLDSDFSTAVGILTLSQGKTPVITYAQDDHRIFLKSVVGDRLNVRETSLVCYNTVPPMNDYVFCTSVWTLNLIDGRNPSLYTFSWYQPTDCV